MQTKGVDLAHYVSPACDRTSKIVSWYFVITSNSDYAVNEKTYRVSKKERPSPYGVLVAFKETMVPFLREIQISPGSKHLPPQCPRAKTGLNVPPEFKSRWVRVHGFIDFRGCEVADVLGPFASGRLGRTYIGWLSRSTIFLYHRQSFLKFERHCVISWSCIIYRFHIDCFQMFGFRHDFQFNTYSWTWLRKPMADQKRVVLFTSKNQNTSWPWTFVYSCFHVVKHGNISFLNKVLHFFGSCIATTHFQRITAYAVSVFPARLHVTNFNQTFLNSSWQAEIRLRMSDNHTYSVDEPRSDSSAPPCRVIYKN